VGVGSEVGVTPLEAAAALAVDVLRVVERVETGLLTGFSSAESGNDANVD